MIPDAHTLLLANVLQGLVGFVWLAGLRRCAGTIAPATFADLLRLTLVLPPAIALARSLEMLPASPWPIMRVSLWGEWIGRIGLPLIIPGVILLGGTGAIFVVQELWPALLQRRVELRGLRVRDPRLDSALQRTLKTLRTQGGLRRRGRPPTVYRLETDRPMAALHGIIVPAVIISRGLLDRLDDEELDAVVAHELGHLALGGNLQLLILWLLRAAQAPNPAALVLFRALIEAREATCDALAVRVTGRPMALASALLKVQSTGMSTTGSALQRARARVQRSADLAAVRQRVDLLIQGASPTDTPHALLLPFALLLALLLWGIA